MDERVLQTQQWLNATYRGRTGYNPVIEDGKTGWNTIYSLTRALQLELGITQTADSFGPTTERLFVPLSKQEEGAEPTNMNFIYRVLFGVKDTIRVDSQGIFMI